MTEAAIAGVRVIDCASGLAGSVAALMLAEAGADVIKVEPPAGDPGRGTAAFAAWNRSKRGIAMDVTGADAAAFGALLAGADVLIEDGARPLPALAEHRHLISCRISGTPAGFGDEALPADDFLVMAASGALAEQPALHRDGPAFVQLPLGSWCAAWLAAVGIGARLAHVARGGAPGPVDTSLLQGMLVPLMMLWRDAERPTAAFDGRIDKHMIPSIFECADGVWLHIMKNADGTPLMRRLLDEMGPEEVASANAEWPGHFRYTNWGANVRAFRSRPSAEWLADLWAADIPVQPALPVGALYDDAQALANGYVVEVDDPALGRVRQPGFPLAIDPPRGVGRPAPRPDEHRAAVLAEPGRRKPPPPPASGKPLLDGVKVVDFGNYLAGPLSTMLLADLGADVVKVEPLAGDPMRANESAFLGCQRGKRSLALDLGHPRAREVIARLVADADIVHHNLRLPSARRFGLDYPDLRAIKNDVIFGHVSAYGPRGDRRYWPGYDQLFQASAGWELANAGDGNRPVWLRFGMMDHLCAMSLAYGMLLALIRREQTGEGSQVAASLLGAGVLTMADVAMRPDGTLIGRTERLDRMQLGVSPGRRLARCADGWVAFSGPDDAAPGEALLAALSKLAGSEALASLRASGLAAVAVEDRGGKAFLFDEDHARLGLVASYEHPVYGTVRHPGAFWSMPDAPLALDRAPPALGEHGRELLQGLGFTENDIGALASDRVVMLPGQ